MTEQQYVTTQYWRESAHRDLSAARDLIKTKHFHWALFIYHLSIEKLLKAHLIGSGITPPLTHDLARLATLAKLSPHDAQQQWLTEITAFNIEARYDSEKLQLYKKATQQYTLLWSKRCEEIFQWLEQKLT